jgi:hypothetical protein
MQIKATMRFHLFLARMAIIKQTTINVDEDTGTKGILVHC